MDYNTFQYLRLITVSPELKVANTIFNTAIIFECLQNTQQYKPDIILFPELCLTGYTCADLFNQSQILNEVEKSIISIAKETKELKITCVIGAPLVHKNRLYNTAIFISHGEILGAVPKIHLPNTNEYYENRWFVSGNNIFNETISIQNKSVPFGINLLFTLKDFVHCKVGIEICEDLWAVTPPSNFLALEGANVILNLSASNDILGKPKYRENLIKQQSARCVAAYAYTSSNANESTTDLLYSGNMYIVENGTTLQKFTQYTFKTKFLIADIDIESLNHDRRKNPSFHTPTPYTLHTKLIEFKANLDPLKYKKKLYRTISNTPFIPKNINKRNEHCLEIFSIQSMALAKRLKFLDFNNKSKKYALIGVSGGLDSTLALLILCKVFQTLNLDYKYIYAINMPSLASSQHTIQNTKMLCEVLGIPLKIIAIDKVINQHLKDLENPLNKYNITYENAQARERMQILMNKANQLNGIVIGTGDLSEMALGWCTYNGDHMSMYHINAGVPKTLVKYMIEWYANENPHLQEVLTSIYNTPITPELIPQENNTSNIAFQETEKIIGPYILHDFFLFYMIRYGFTIEKILFLASIAFKSTYTLLEIKKYLKIFYKRFYSNQFKRSATPDSIKIGSVSLSQRGDWKMPSDVHADLIDL